jgi:hypothetical protein
MRLKVVRGGVMLRVLVALALYLPLSGCDLFGFHDWEWHQKLTVSVMTPEGLKTASSVTEGSWSMAPTWFKIGDSGGGPGLGRLRGEAVVLELVPQKYLFALQDYSAMTAIYAIAGPNFRPGMRQDYIAVLDRMETISDSRTLTPKHHPLLVTFDDINDPASVRRVDPSNLPATFGHGYRLNAVTLSITDEPVTRGRVEKVLGWLAWSRDRLLAAGNGRNPVQLEIGNGLLALDRADFRRAD